MIIYTKDSKGRIRQLEVKTEGSTLFQISGLCGGKLIEKSKVITEKNVGKANYKTGAEVALEHRDSLLKKKLRSGYYETFEEAMDNVFIEPTLAKKYLPEKHKIVFRNKKDEPKCYVQRKLDGMRCYTILDGNGSVLMMSRGFKVLSTSEEEGECKFPHIENELLKYRGMPVIIDGELYAHNLSFDDNTRLHHKNRGGDNPLKYHIYDTMSEKEFSLRKDLFNSFGENVVKVESELITLEKEYKEFDSQYEAAEYERQRYYDKIQSLHDEYVLDGYEGAMVRWGETGYEMKRTSHLLKMKVFDDITAKVIDVVPQEADPTMGKIECIGTEGVSKGQKFLVSFNGSHERQRELLSNKNDYIGKTAEIRCFGFTDKGIPRIAKCAGFRTDK